MKNSKRILCFLMVAVMMLTVIPAVSAASTRPHTFTAQPESGETDPGYSTLTVTWKLNFLATQVDVYDENNEVKKTYVDCDSVEFSCELPVGTYYVRAYYSNTGLYVDSDTFTVTATPAAFVTQPQGGSVSLREGTRSVSCTVNVTPNEYRVYNGTELYTTITPSGRFLNQCTVALPSSDEPYQIHVFYQTDTSGVIISDEFYITPYTSTLGFTSYPEDTEISGGEVLLSWSTNFTPVSLTIYKNGEQFEILSDPTETSYTFTPGTWKIRAQILTSVRQEARYVEGAEFTVTTTAAFTKQPVGGEVENEDDTITVSWGTNFTPRKTQYINGGAVLVTIPTTTVTPLPPSFPTSAAFGVRENAYTIRAFYGNGDDAYVESDEFYVTVRQQETEPETKIAQILGDADQSGSVTITDATYIQRFIALLSVPDTFSETAADVNGNGKPDITDATYIQRWLAGLTVDYAINEEIK